MKSLILAALVASAAAAPYNFISFGDYGTGSELQRENAAAINKYCAAAADNCQFTALLADNFYDGPLTTEDPRWFKDFSAMYNSPNKFYTCLGNHDYKGSIAAQINFKNDTRWVLPASNYSVVIPEADLTILFLDTPRACPSYMSKPYGDCNENCMTQLAAQGCTNSTDKQCWADHVAWADSVLAGVTTKWIFAAGHHPIDQENMPSLAPVLQKRGVQAYLAGHVHNLQHATGGHGTSTVEYFVSGAGAFDSALRRQQLINGVEIGPTHAGRPIHCAAGTPCEDLQSYFMADGPGFLTMSLDNDATPATATASFIHWNGTTLYTYSFHA